MNAIAEQEERPSAKAPADQAEAKARVEALYGLTIAVAQCIRLWPDAYHRRLLARAVADLSDELDFEDPYERIEELEAEPDLEDVLRDVRAAIKRDDVEHALLLIHYELGDY
jgi:hypothetical protein